MDIVKDFIAKRGAIDRKQIAIDFAKSLNHPEIVKIILFGSVARGDDNKDSDIDILILTTDKDKIRKTVYSKVSDILLETMEVISVKIKTTAHYEKNKNTSFFSNVFKDGVVLH